MSSSLQEQLLKAGLVNKDKAQKLAQQHSKSKRRFPGNSTATKPAAADTKRAARDRALAEERNARARARELEHQLRQLVDSHKLERKGDLPYAFTEGGSVKRIYVDEAQRSQLSAGALVVVRVGARLELLPRAAAERVRERAPEAIVLDHAAAVPEKTAEAVEGYEGYEVPDDLVW